MQNEDLDNRIITWLKEGIPSPQVQLIGVSGVQGIGKSTLCKRLVSRLETLGLRAVTISLDDFYLTHEGQLNLRREFPNNLYLEWRGYPGTHDLTLAHRVLDSFLNARAGEDVKVPAYDKSAFDGEGDRVVETQWPIVKGSVDYILLEGWMLGFESVPLSETPSEFMQVNIFLERYHSLWEKIDRFILLDAPRTDLALNWRKEAELKRIAEGNAGMNAEKIEAYTRRFLPAYNLYLPALRRKMDQMPKQSALHLKIDENRNLISV